MQGREMDRVVRAWFVTDDGTPDRRAARAASGPGRRCAWRRPRLAAWNAGPERIVAVDPLGNLVLAYPRDPDIKGDGARPDAAAQGVADRLIRDVKLTRQC